MNASELKKYIYENDKIHEVLEEIGCHHVKYHSSGYFTAANPTGDNQQAITVYVSEILNVVNYTRDLPIPSDIITLTEYNLSLNFFQAFKHLCDFLELDPYTVPEDNLPESLKVTKMLIRMMNKDQEQAEDETPIKVIPESILSYYKPYVNDFWKNDHVPYSIQREWELGYDEETNRITMPVRDEIGQLVGVKGRLFKKDLKEDELKYLYIEPTPRERILYGLYKTMPYIQEEGRVFVGESEKFCHQLWSYGYKNCIATGGERVSQHQIDKLIRLAADIVLCMDQDVSREKIDNIADRFAKGINVYAMLDEDRLLKEKQSPSDDFTIWEKMVRNNIYRIR